LSTAYDDANLRQTFSQRLAFKVSKIFREVIVTFVINGEAKSKTAAYSLVPANTIKTCKKLPFTEFLRVGTLAAGTNPDQEEFKFWSSIEERAKSLTSNKKYIAVIVGNH